MQTLHIVSHTHWDREWYKTFQQFRLQLVHLIDNLLTILEKDPEYKFFMLDGQTIVLEDYLQMRMANLPLLQNYIREGRLLIGPWYILPDEYLVSPEATVRNLLIGKEICDLFGRRMMVGYIPDPFGHIGQMPQILNGFHMDTACLWRGVPKDSSTALIWEAPDGSRVLLAHLYNGYGNVANWPVADVDQSVYDLDAAVNDLAPYNPTSQFLMMRGTDHYEPRPSVPVTLAHYDQKSSDRKAVHSTLPTYLAALTAEIEEKGLDLPVLHGELRDPRKAHMLPAVLSARMWIKQRNWYSQTLLERWVEPFTTWAELLVRGENAFTPLAEFDHSGRIADPAPLVHQAWKLLIANHPHDSICGCSIDETHNDMLPRFDQVDQIGEILKAQSLKAIAARADTQVPGSVQDAFAAVTVFNASPYSQSAVVEVAVDCPSGKCQLEMVDEDGAVLTSHSEPLPRRYKESNTFAVKELMGLLTGAASEGHDSQTLVRVQLDMEAQPPVIDAEFSSILPADQANLETVYPQVMGFIMSTDPSSLVHVNVWNVAASKVRFLAPEVPAVGYRTFWVRGTSTEQAEPEPTEQDDNGVLSISNDLFEVSVEANDCSLTLVDKRDGRRFEGVNTFIDGGDRGDEYNFTPPEHDVQIKPNLLFAEKVATEVEECLILHGTCLLPAKLAKDRAYRSEAIVDCPISVVVTLAKDQPYIDFAVRFDNQAEDHRLEVRFPTGLNVKSARFDGHYEVVERALDLPSSDATWRELPRPEVPQRAFTDVSEGGQGMMLANQGLPEVAVLRDESGKATISLTLLRCVGWLSRDDLWNRQGQAGPPLETPEAQMIGEHTFNYRLIPHQGDWMAASQHAHNYQTPLAGLVSTSHKGEGNNAARMITSTPDCFLITAVKQAVDEKGFIVRGVNLSNEEQAVSITASVPVAYVRLVNLDESPIQDLEIMDGHVSSTAKPAQVLSFYFGITE